ncbi:HAMP domain-containing histidine kinase [Cyanobacterium aponinum FACHB-4101]|uniref:sensor histidine kinase n=1 Tax=Cyanobacterium aponinum TaxID=379064 RepID=UPI00168115DC|nr:HAMP domain-containing sensor histidine kinase [Cyanobacterium aponinum]MBD2394755.1 HAMP domain-containing histidine kinase [Cyanobacterium aponinum FACHB-4101]
MQLTLKPFVNLRLWEKKKLLILSVFIILITLEFKTPPAYVFGYLYTGAILLVNVSYGGKATFIATIISVFLTLLNLYVHIGTVIELPTLANRLIATLSLIVTGWLSNSNRIYQQKIVEQQTKLQSQEELVRLRQDFASTLTHDLRTPLLGAIETIKAFQNKQFGEITPTQIKVLATMIRSHQSSLQLVNTLLDVYRNDLEGLHLKLYPLDLTVLVEEVANSLTSLASSNQVYLTFNYGDSDFRQSLWVNGDVFQLKRVLTNLLINAINHSRRGDRIEIILSSNTVRILDYGSGIKPDDFPFLFDRFYQSNSDRQAKGTGLGLYLCRQIIEAHGGKIWAENHSKGAIFGFTLPVYQG